MSSTAKNTIVVVIVVIIIAALFFMFRGDMNNGSMTGNENATGTVSTSTVSGNNSATGGNNSTGGTQSGATAVSDATLNTLLDSAAIRVPNTGVDVALTQGQASYTNGAVKGQITRGKVLGKVSTEAGHDVFVNLVLTTQGSSVQQNYVALFRLNGTTVTYTSAVVVGDRLTVQSVVAKPDPSAPMTTPQQFFNSSSPYILDISYLDRKNGEPVSATPSVQKTMTVHVKNHIVSK